MEFRAPSYRVVDAVARELGESPTTLSPPLHDVIDTDALNALFERQLTREHCPLQIGFEYQGYDVSVLGNGDEEIIVRVAPTAERKKTTTT